MLVTGDGVLVRVDGDKQGDGSDHSSLTSDDVDAKTRYNREIKNIHEHVSPLFSLILHGAILVLS
jgi:hypothetical protein